MVHQLERQLQTTKVQTEKAEQVAELSNRIGALTHGIDNLALHLMQNPALGAELAGLFKDLQAAQQELEEARKVPIYPSLTLHEDVTVQDLQDLLFLLGGTPASEIHPASPEPAGAAEVQLPVEPLPEEKAGEEGELSEEVPEAPGEPAPEEADPSEIPVQIPDLQQVALATPNLQREVQRLLDALLPQPREELLSLMPRSADPWEQVDTHFKLRTLLNKLRLEQPTEEATANLTRWYASFRHREVQVLELIDPDLEGEKELAWLVFAAFLHSVHRWELPTGTGRYRVYFKNPRTCERIEQFLRHATTPVTVQEINRVLMLQEEQLEAALSLLPFAQRLPDGRYRYGKTADAPTATPPSTRPSTDENWFLILEVLDPRWHALAHTLAGAGLPAPDDCHVDLHDGVQVTGSQALLLWSAAKVAVVESSEVTSAAHRTFPVNLPDLAHHLQRALEGR
ncbi:hypothetical protein DC3_48110 [Deinococcus cellulosilyticus NBRC 106333 = KACC 11606]|uniref:Uncharacterized protein n=1 Tax=Deinococcus cellulosilyticus (strain DSM 18568 / NBRC 106333 / KACC 11606 / 5516J-15) TaxID=1223518 RepID=A0A511N9I1_DEIC1|nr:hypothetical protein DC3_48110 [Deinococcus cellulosilyticus NBRC 106333 = KACC 11606]